MKLEEMISIFKQLEEDNQRVLIMIANGIRMGQESVKKEEV